MWSNRNVRLIKGQLELKIEDNQSKEWPFSCAEVQSRKMFGYGTYEGRIRSVAASGAVTSFFTFVGPALNKKYPHDEIDIEFLGRNSNSVQLNYFSDGIGYHEHHVPLTIRLRSALQKDVTSRHSKASRARAGLTSTALGKLGLSLK